MGDKMIANFIGPRRVGGTYLNGYWQRHYEVEAIHTGQEARELLYSASDWAITIRWIDTNETRTHCTPWDARRDAVIAQPRG